MYERCIVVGTDFSDGARDALDRALRIAGDHAYEDAPGAEVAEDRTPRLLELLSQMARPRGRRDGSVA